MENSFHFDYCASKQSNGLQSTQQTVAIFPWDILVERSMKMDSEKCVVCARWLSNDWSSINKSTDILYIYFGWKLIAVIDLFFFLSTNATIMPFPTNMNWPWLSQHRGTQCVDSWRWCNRCRNKLLTIYRQAFHRVCSINDPSISYPANKRVKRKSEIWK